MAGTNNPFEVYGAGADKDRSAATKSRGKSSGEMQMQVYQYYQNFDDADSLDDDYDDAMEDSSQPGTSP